jgi:hypothetical protein
MQDSTHQLRNMEVHIENSKPSTQQARALHSIDSVGYQKVCLTSRNISNGIDSSQLIWTITQ